MNLCGQWTCIAGLASGLALGGFQGAGAQSLVDLIADCASDPGADGFWCAETALAVQAAQGALGLAASGGADLPGSASTLGWRTKGSPRIALSLRGSLTRSPMPSLKEVSGRPSGEGVRGFYSVQGAATVGIFDGISLGPTVGGFGSVDLTASAQWIRTPRDGGLGEGVTGWGIGGRIGILRESFTLPGISFSVARRWMGETDLWNSRGTTFAGTGFDLAVTSIRGVIGKDIMGMGVFGGAGWDRYSGDASIAVRASSWGSQDLAASGSVRSDRRLYFLGASMTFLALQVSGEVGLANGFDPQLPAEVGGGFDPERRSHYGALGLRLTF